MVDAYRVAVRASVGSVKLLLLTVFCTRVLGMGRDFLSLLWVYFLVESLIWLLASGGFFLLRLDYFALNPAALLMRNLSVATIASVPLYLALLWFARQASRISLTHAFFLVAITMFVVARPYPSHQVTEWIGAFYGTLLVWAVATLGVLLLKVWLLGNFDSRGPGFRRNAIIGVIAATIAAGIFAFLLVSLLGYLEELPSVAVFLVLSWSKPFFFYTSVNTALLGIGVMLALVGLGSVWESRRGAPAAEGGVR